VLKSLKIFEILMYTGVAAYLEFFGLRLRDMCFVAVPVGVWLATLNHWNKGVCLYPN
jgi:hypothetical protein